MRTVYIDHEFKCHTSNVDGTMTAVETDFFDGKCDAVVGGSRFIPKEQTWTREDGKVFSGEMATLWKDSVELDKAQREYEKQLLAEYESALAEIEAALGV